MRILLYILSLFLFLPLLVDLFKLNKKLSKKYIKSFYIFISLFFIILLFFVLKIQPTSSSNDEINNLIIYANMVVVTYFPLLIKFSPDKQLNTKSINKNILKALDFLIYKILIIILAIWGAYEVYFLKTDLELIIAIITMIMFIMSCGIILVVFPLGIIRILEYKLLKY